MVVAFKTDMWVVLTPEGKDAPKWEKRLQKIGKLLSGKPNLRRVPPSKKKPHERFQVVVFAGPQEGSRKEYAALSTIERAVAYAYYQVQAELFAVKAARVQKAEPAS